VLTVHDELVFEVPASRVRTYIPRLVKHMEKCHQTRCTIDSRCCYWQKLGWP